MFKISASNWENERYIQNFGREASTEGVTWENKE
jgi:hypothetical protein